MGDQRDENSHSWFGWSRQDHYIVQVSNDMEKALLCQHDPPRDGWSLRYTCTLSLTLRLQVGEVVTTIPSEWVGLGRLTWTCCSPQQVFVCSQRGGEETHTWGTKLLHEPLLCMTAVLSTFMVGFSSVAAIDKCIMVCHHGHHRGHHQSFLFPFWLQVASHLVMWWVQSILSYPNPLFQRVFW